MSDTPTPAELDDMYGVACGPTHHNACACREWYFTDIERENARLNDELAQANVKIERLTARLFKRGEMRKPPCFVCGYNGAGYYNPDMHPCAAKHHDSN